MSIPRSAAPHQVLILLDSLGVGGAAQVALNQALSLNRQKFSPIVCATHTAPAYGQDETLRRAGVPFIEIQRQSVWQFWPWVRLWRVLPSVSILHSHGSGANFWGRFWGRLFRVPLIITHYHTAAAEKAKVVHFSDKAMRSLSSCIVTISQFDRDLAIKIESLDPDRVVTIYNGIDISRFDIQLSKPVARRRAGLPEDKQLIAIVARLAAQKNHQGLLEALALLPEDDRSKPHCLIVGSGPLESQLRRDVEMLGMKDSVSFLGEREDVPIILKAIDLFVLPSHWECLPMVVLEALAAQCPIVATAVGGVPEVLAGLGWPLVDPGDPTSVAEAMAHVLRMPEMQRNRIADAGRRRVAEKFSREAAALEVERLYESHLSSSPRLRA
jgi:glycosyltransferase involved in cell wall biosynthesis